MEKIELTELHKSKLLEMCKELFPKYYKTEFSDDYKFFEGWNEGDDPNLMIFYPKPNTIGIEIHWFEFCHCHLLPKLIKDRNLKLQFYMDTFTGNPVDYLYEAFKKLKK